LKRNRRSINNSPIVLDQERNGPYVGVFGALKVTLLVGIMSTSWLLFIQLHASVGVLLAIAGNCILSFTKEDNMIKTIAKAIILTVGTALLGRPTLAACFQLQRGECTKGSDSAT